MSPIRVTKLVFSVFPGLGWSRRGVLSTYRELGTTAHTKGGTSRAREQVAQGQAHNSLITGRSLPSPRRRRPGRKQLMLLPDGEGFPQEVPFHLKPEGKRRHPAKGRGDAKENGQRAILRATSTC